MTAEELMRQLEADAAFVARRAARDAEMAERLAVSAADERPLVAELQAAGYDVASVWDFVSQNSHPALEPRFVGPYPKAYPILVRHLRVAHRREIREGVIRALTVRDGGSDVESALWAEFVDEAAPELRWALANALKVAMPYSRRRKHPEIEAAFRDGPSGT